MARRARDSKGRFVKKGRARRKTTRKKARRNPPRARAVARTAPRDRFGRFVGKGGSSRRRARSNPGRYVRSNPVRGDIVGTLVDSTVCAAQLTLGKAASRALPDLVNLPQGGNVGVAIRAGAGVVLGYAADMAGFRDLGGKLLEGALQGCVEDYVVQFNIPFLADALRRPPGVVPAVGGGGGTTGFYTSAPHVRGAGTGAYVPRSRGGRMGRYVQAGF